MQRTLRNYMRLDPWEAVIAMVNDNYNLALNPVRTEIVSMEPFGADMRITLMSERSPGLGNMLPPFEQKTFQYTRVELGEFFRLGLEPFVFHPTTFPTTTVEATELLTAQTGVVFGRNDIQHVEILQAATQSFDLSAHPMSLRWYGSLSILPGTASRGELRDYLSDRKLGALAYPEWAGLYAFLPDRNLDALTPPNFT